MRALTILLFTFFDICRLRLGPQDIPASRILLSLVLFGYIIVGIVLSSVKLDPLDAILFSLVESILSIMIIGSLLHIAKKITRFYQTLTALAGTDTLFGGVRIPLIYWLAQLQSMDSFIASFLFVLLLTLVIWNLIVYAHILKNALEVSFSIGVILTVVSSLLSTSILYQIFPMIIE